MNCTGLLTSRRDENGKNLTTVCSLARLRSVWIVIILVAPKPAAAAEIRFEVGVMAALSKAGCNAGTCHGNLNGKGGFKLSLRGQDPTFDYQSLVFASRGRRLNFGLPEQSLFLRKATGAVPHRGGIRFNANSPVYDLFLEWMRNGAAGPEQGTPVVEQLLVSPADALVRAPSHSLQVQVVAMFSDGSSVDVTRQACYELSNLNATVDESGRVDRLRFGETTLVVRYLQQQAPVRIAFIAERPDFRWQHPPENNRIDQLVFAKLRRLRIVPATLAADSVFVRRAFLDAIGRLPTADEARRFVHDRRSGKRERLVDTLLARPEFADFWALKWADVLRTEEKVLDTRGVEIFHGWIRESIATGKPVDRFVRELVTGQGNTFEQPAANYYRANRDSSTRGETTARLFLGIRLQCAKCHNHPFDRWTQDDYYQWSSLFSQIDYELGENKRKDKLDKNEFAGMQKVLFAKQDEVRNPNTGSVAQPKLLGGETLREDQLSDRLNVMAGWLAGPDNQLFAKSQVNFIWYHLMGRGLVDPIDDFRLTNPSSNPELLELLAAEFVASGFELHHLVRTIMNSRTYQLASRPNATNTGDETSYSRAYIRRLPAEVLLDMQSDVLDVPAEFAGYPAGLRAVQIPGIHRVRRRDGSPAAGDRFLRTFGKPERILACDCERSSETTLKQAFVLLGEGLSERLAAEGNRLRRLASSGLSDAEIVDELYWTALSRSPTGAETEAALHLFATPDTSRQEALEDIAWALLNAKEFLFRN